jgi:N-acetylglucosaminyl-diphospho-decaprenol L-rhamnosyltransferase
MEERGPKGGEEPRTEERASAPRLAALDSPSTDLPGRPDALRPLSPPPSGGRKKHRPDVSVCVVNWNCRSLLRGCLRSLRAVRDVQLEVIVVDNGSTDGAADMVERCFPEVVLIRNADNAGFSRANNQAARMARGRYLFFLNNDTLVPPDALRRLLDYAEAHPEAGLIGPRLRDGLGVIQGSCRRRPSLPALLHRVTWLRWTGLFARAYRRYRGRAGAATMPQPAEVLMGAALLMRRRVFLECGPWDETFTFGGEDIELCSRVGRRYAVVHHPGIEITHFGRVASRLQVGPTFTHTLIGITRCLRQAGCSRPGLWAYKAAVTADLPLQWLVHAGQYLWRRLRGRPAFAAKSLLVLRGLNYFLARGLVPFWKV